MCLCTNNLDVGNRQIELLTVDSRGKSWEEFHCLFYVFLHNFIFYWKMK